MGGHSGYSFSKSTHHRYRSMIVAVIAMWMVKMSVDKVVDVIAVRYGFVSASRAMHMIGVVPLAIMPRRATARVGVGNIQSVLFDLTVRADMMQVTVMEEVNVVAVLNAGVFAVRSMFVVVIGVQISHGKTPYLGVDSSIACMTPLVTSRETCSSASA